MVFTTWRLASCAKPKLILWLWEKIRKSWYACLHTVMFCHGWQNKAASSHGWLVVAVHVTPRKSNSGIPRLFLFSDNGTKITSALRKMPLTNLRHTIGTGDLFHKQTSIWWDFYTKNGHSSKISTAYAHFPDALLFLWQIRIPYLIPDPKDHGRWYGKLVKSHPKECLCERFIRAKLTADANPASFLMSVIHNHF